MSQAKFIRNDKYRRNINQKAKKVKMNVDHEIELLITTIKRLGQEGADGKISVTFGVLFDDEEAANTFEAIVGTLKAAKKRQLISYKGQLLLKGVHDNEVITLLKES